jgi:hypothetical protein
MCVCGVTDTWRPSHSHTQTHTHTHTHAHTHTHTLLHGCDVYAVLALGGKNTQHTHNMSHPVPVPPPSPIHTQSWTVAMHA